jgi:hypothetical protein
MMTQLSSKAPYTIHITSFTAAIRNMFSETSLADFEFHVLITWVKKVRQVIAPAAYPKMSTPLIKKFLIF